MSDLPNLTPDVRGYLSELGKRGSASLHAGTTPEERRDRTAAARAARSARPTTSQRLAAAEAALQALRAEVEDLRQLVAA